MANRNYIGFEVLANGNNAVSRILEVVFVILVFLDIGCGIEKWYWFLRILGAVLRNGIGRISTQIQSFLPPQVSPQG